MDHQSMLARTAVFVFALGISVVLSAILFITGSVTFASASPTTTIVCKGVDDRLAIQSAIDQGGIVTLQGTCVHNSPIVLRQAKGMNHESGATIIEGGVLVGPGVIVDGGRKLGIRNTEIRSTGVGITARNAIMLSLHNVIIRSPSTGIDLQTVAGTWITGNTRVIGVRGNGSYGIKTGHSDIGYEAVWAYGLRIEDHDGGVRIGGQGNNHNMSFTNVKVTGAKWFGFLINPSGEAYVHNIQINNCAIDGAEYPIATNSTETTGKIARIVVNGCSIANSQRTITNWGTVTDMRTDNIIQVASIPSTFPPADAVDPVAISSSPKTPVVCASGNSHAVIQAALDKGGHITFKGICYYDKPLYIRADKPRTILEGGTLWGVGSGGIVIDGVQSPVLRELELRSDTVALDIKNSKDIRLHNVYIHSEGHSVTLENVDGFTATGMTHLDGTPGRNSYGILGATWGPVKNVTLIQTNWETHDGGMRFGSADHSNFTFTDLKLDRIKWFPLLINPAGNGSARNITINNCLVHDSGFSLALTSSETKGTVEAPRLNGCLLLGNERNLSEWGSVKFNKTLLITGPSNTPGKTHIVTPAYQ